MIKILHVLSRLNKGSGVANVVMNYYKNIDRNKIQFDFLYFIKSDNDYINEIKQYGGNIFFMEKPSITGYRQFKKYINDFFKLNASEYKAVQLHEVYLNGFLFPAAKKYGIKNCIAHVHTTKYSDKKLHALRNRVLCLSLKHEATHYFACSKEAGDFYYGKKLARNGKVQIINNAINYKAYVFNPKIRKLYREKFQFGQKMVVGHIGRFNEQKNHKFLIEIFYELLKRKPESFLVLVGNGPLEYKIKEEVKKRKIQSKVLFLGIRDDVPQIIQAMDIFLLPSLFEGLGIVAIEAQISGLPTIVSDRVPKEAKILSSFEAVKLSNSPSEWSEIILTKHLNERSSNRRIDETVLGKSRFNIQREAGILEKIYLDL